MNIYLTLIFTVIKVHTCFTFVFKLLYLSVVRVIVRKIVILVMKRTVDDGMKRISHVKLNVDVFPRLI
jgi:hypothetical protein